VVALGETAVEPDGAVTVPTPWLIVKAVAFVELQLSVELCPRFTVEGLALRVTVGTGPEGVTVTVAVAVNEAPPVNIAVPV
jgi:hypothetical protein